MDGKLWCPAGVPASQATVRELLECNAITHRYGLALTAADAQALAETHAAALKASGRVDFTGDLLKKLIVAFCDSPWLDRHNYVETLHALTETFYYFKNETLDALGDDELIACMKDFFDGSCRGAIDLLQRRELEQLAHDIRFFGRPSAENAEDQDETEDYHD